jgi:hypothetical protein
MPREIQGTWCPAGDNGGQGVMDNGFNNKVDIYYRTTGHDRHDIHCRGGDPNWIVIDPNGYEAYEAGCSFGSSSVAGYERSRPVYQVAFKGECAGEADYWNESWRAFVDADGKLNIRQKVTNQGSE